MPEEKLRTDVDLLAAGACYDEARRVSLARTGEPIRARLTEL